MTGNRGRPLSPPRNLSGPLRARSTVRHSTPHSGHHAASPSGDKGQDTSEYLNIAERWWRAHQPWLEKCGYLLRARYRQDWIPSWQRKGPFFSKLRTYEDMIELPVRLPVLTLRAGTTLGPYLIVFLFSTQATSRRIDATRISDGHRVHLYLVSEKMSPEEADIMLRLTSRKFAEVPDAWENHTIPVFEVLDVYDDSNLCVVVTPLMRGYNDPWFETMGEAVDFLSQILEVCHLSFFRSCQNQQINFFQGMKFMHAHGIAHRNPQLSGDAIVYDPTECHPEGFHPVVTKMNPCFSGEAFKHTRTERPVTYYFADFRTAKRYRRRSTPPASSRRSKRKLKCADGVTVMDYPLLWKKNFAPEFMTPEKKCDPFKVDVYLLGVEISRGFLEVRDYSTFKGEGDHDTDDPEF